jgi:outer membrane protein
MNSKNIMTALAIAAAALCGTAQAQNSEGPWLVRLRAVNIDSANDDATGLGLSINNKVIPEVDVSYFFNKSWSTELVLTVPQTHTLYSKGARIGQLDHLPPTLLLQYHWDGQTLQPYVGAGINYTRFSSVQAPAGVGITENSWGGALQLGVDVKIGNNMVFNVDVKKVYIGTDVSSNGSKLGSFKVDPVLVGVGLGWRF